MSDRVLTSHFESVSTDNYPIRSLLGIPLKDKVRRQLIKRRGREGAEESRSL